jgi:hypothetical protein
MSVCIYLKIMYFFNKIFLISKTTYNWQNYIITTTSEVMKTLKIIVYFFFKLKPKNIHKIQREEVKVNESWIFRTWK